MKKLTLSLLCVLSLVAALPAFAGDEAYYKEFLYKQECTDDGDGEQHCQWRNLMGMETYNITPLFRIHLQVSVFLNDDMTATFRYNEMHEERDNESAPWRFKMHSFCTIEKNGSWSAPQDFVMGDLITGKRATWHTQNAVEITLAKVIDSPELAGKSMVLSYGYSNVAKDPLMPPACPELK